MFRIPSIMSIWMGSWLLYFSVNLDTPFNQPVSFHAGATNTSLTSLAVHLPAFIAPTYLNLNTWLNDWPNDLQAAWIASRKNWFWGSGAAILGFSIMLLCKDDGDRHSSEKELEQKIKELEQTLLRVQMNPHFIFNALNSIQNFVATGDKNSSVIYLSKFSNLIRKTLEHSFKNEICLNDEVALLEGYLELEQLRFNRSFEYKIKVHPSLDAFDTTLPPMIVQPFIENAIFHGLASKKDIGMVLVEFAPYQTGLMVTVKDNGIGIIAAKALKKDQPQNHQSMGMKITAKRLRLLDSQNRKTRLNIRELADVNGKAEGTEVKMILC